MKTSKLIAVALALIIGLTNCKNSDPDPIIEEGVPTSVRIILTQAKSQTRAADSNATDDEVALHNAYIFIYNTAGVFQDRHNLTSGDFSYDGTGGDYHKASTTFTTISGRKIIHVAVNIPEEMANFIQANGVSAVYELTDPSVLYSPGATLTGMGMFNVKEESHLIEPDPANNTISIQVARFAAKVSVHAKADMIVETENETYENIKFSIGNYNTKLYPLQKAGYVDPNYDAAINLPAIPYQADFKDDLASTRFLEINPADRTGINDFTVKYALENTSTNHLKGETTYAAIEATFIPKNWSTYDGTTLTTTSHTGAPIAPLYQLVTSSNIYYFANENDATTYNTSIGGAGEIKEYAEGKCYYFVWLNPGGSSGKTAPYDVLRNDYYKINITKINSVGATSPTIPDTEKPKKIEEDANISLTIEVLQWNKYEDDEILGR